MADKLKSCVQCGPAVCSRQATSSCRQPPGKLSTVCRFRVERNVGSCLLSKRVRLLESSCCSSLPPLGASLQSLPHPACLTPSGFFLSVAFQSILPCFVQFQGESFVEETEWSTLFSSDRFEDQFLLVTRSVVVRLYTTFKR